MATPAKTAKQQHKAHDHHDHHGHDHGHDHEGPAKPGLFSRLFGKR